MNFREFLQESKKDKEFETEVKMSDKDFKAWAKANKSPEVQVDTQGSLAVIYVNDKHIATYDKSKSVLMLDEKNIKIFGKFI